MRFSVWLLAATLLSLGPFFSRMAEAGEIPYSLTTDSTVLYYYTSGYLHDDAQRVDYGLGVNFTYPLSSHLHLTAMAVFGLQSEFQFFGGGFTYQFVPSVITHTKEGDAISVETYRKWRPYVQFLLGQNTAETLIDADHVHAQVVESTAAAWAAVGCGYALNSAWELNTKVLFLYGVNADMSVLSTGLQVGLKYNLF